MKFQSRFTFPILLTLAMACVSTLCGAGRCLTGACLTVPLPSAMAAAFQQGPGRGAAAAPRDPELEKQSTKSLEVAWYYFKKKPNKSDPAALDRLNKSVEGRLNEILDIHPDFSKMDEVCFLLGEVYARSKQPDKAVEFFGKVVKDFPDSRFNKDAKKHLDELNASQGNKKSQ